MEPRFDDWAPLMSLKKLKLFLAATYIAFALRPTLLKMPPSDTLLLWYVIVPEPLPTAYP